MLVIDDRGALKAWLDAGGPEPATVLALDLLGQAGALAAATLKGSIFLGCTLDDDAVRAIRHGGARMIDELGQLPASLPAFATGIYTVPDLYAGLAPDGTNWEHTPDHDGFAWFMDGPSKPRSLDLVEMLAARLHDSVQERDVVAMLRGRKVVAIMGGHDFPRQLSPTDVAAGKPDVYWQCVAIAKTLAEFDFLILTGGGPGLMEAANLGALLAGSTAADVAAVKALLTNQTFGSAEWRATAMAARTLILGTFDAEPQGQRRSLGIPTWFYGHEPPNMFASHHAKMFYNSLREDGLVTWANSGIIFFEGNGGTVQEIFQDASQNYYPAPGTSPTPMIFFNTNGYWERPCNQLSQPGDKDRRKPLMPLVRQLAIEKNFTASVLVSDHPQEAIDFLLAAAKAAQPSKADVKLGQAQ